MPAGSKGYARVSFDRTISALGGQPFRPTNDSRTGGNLYGNQLFNEIMDILISGRNSGQTCHVSTAEAISPLLAN